MALPAGFPPRRHSGSRSIRFYVTATATANFEDRAYLFKDGQGANTFDTLPVVKAGSTSTVNLGPTPQGGGTADIPTTDVTLFAGTILVYNVGPGDIQISFDGVNTHGYIKAGTERVYRNRIEAGIAVKGAGAVFHVEAW